MSREYALALHALIERAEEFIDEESDEVLRAAVRQDGYLCKAIEEVRRHAPEGRLPFDLDAEWSELASIEKNKYWPDLAGQKAAYLVEVASERHITLCEFVLSSKGIPVWVFSGDDADGPSARSGGISLQDLVGSVSNPKDENDLFLVDLVVKWVNEGSAGKDEEAFVELWAAVKSEWDFHRVAKKLLPEYKGREDDARLEARVFKYAKLPPSEFTKLDAPHRTEFVNLALDEMRLAICNAIVDSTVPPIQNHLASVDERLDDDDRAETSVPFARVTVDESNRCVARAGVSADFAGKAIPWFLFLQLWKSRGGTCDRRSLLSAAWSGDSLATDDNVTPHITTVRKLIKPLKLSIKPVRNLGYRLLDDMTENP